MMRKRAERQKDKEECVSFAASCVYIDLTRHSAPLRLTSALWPPVNVSFSYLRWKRSCLVSLPASGQGGGWSDGSAQTFSSPGRLWTNDHTRKLQITWAKSSDLGFCSWAPDLPGFKVDEVKKRSDCRENKLLAPATKTWRWPGSSNTKHLMSWWKSAPLEEGSLPHNRQMISRNPCPRNSGGL